MRILPAYFTSGEEFLRDFQPAAPEFDGPALALRTRIEAVTGEHVLVELAVPRLPNRELLRAEVAGPGPGGIGVWLVFSAADRATLDFAVATARKSAARGIPRSHERYPIALPCDWQISGDRTRILSTTEDVSAGGAFVRAYAPPEIGTELVVELPMTATGALKLHGHVAWIRRDEHTSGMGIHFSPAPADDARRLRELLRRSNERGRVQLNA
jgi:hypothetical protein